MTTLDNALDDVVTVAAIGSITFLGYHDVTDTMIIGGVAGLGGYRILKDRRADNQ